jgi:hypothetical protein
MTVTNEQSVSPLAAFVHDCLEANEEVYAVVDGARDLELARTVPEHLGTTVLSLFDEPGATDLADVAPYLVNIHPASSYLDRWGGRLGSSAGILLLAKSAPLTLRTHLRGNFRVCDEEDTEYFFRFYDPRVLRPFLPTCTRSEARNFFGPIREILVEDFSPDVVLRCSVGWTGVGVTKTSLQDYADLVSNEGAAQ